MTGIFLAPWVALLILQIELFLRSKHGLEPSGWRSFARLLFSSMNDPVMRGLRFVMLAGAIFVLWEGLFWSLLGQGPQLALVVIVGSVWMFSSCVRFWYPEVLHRSWSMLGHFAFWSLLCGAFVAPILFAISIFIRLLTLERRRSSRVSN